MRPSAFGAALAARLSFFGLRFGRGSSHRRRSSPSAACVEALEARAMLSGLAGLQITNTDNQTTAVPGTTVTYTVVVSNMGTSELPSVAVEDAFFGAITSAQITATQTGGASGAMGGSGSINQFVDLPAGSSVTYSIVADISPSATGILSTTARAVTDAGSVSATDTDNLTPQADVSVTMQQKPGQMINSATYTIVVSNVGPSDAPDATLLDRFPSDWYVTWYDGGTNGFGSLDQTLDLPAGGSRTYTVSAFAPQETGNFVNTATVTAGPGVADPNPNNNSAAQTLPLFDAQVPQQVSTLEQSTAPITVATFTYGDNTTPASDFTGTINWDYPNGATTPADIAQGSNGYYVVGTHAYAEEGFYYTSIVITTPPGTFTTPSTTSVAVQGAYLPHIAGSTTDMQFVEEAYEDVFGRGPDIPGLVYWSDQLQAGMSRETLAQRLLASPEYTDAQVQATFQQYLHRSADPSALAYFAPKLAGGMSPVTLDEILVTSPEFWKTQAGGTNDGFLDALWLNALKRPLLDQGGRQFFDNLLAHGGTPADVARLVFSSVEYADDVVTDLYEQYLDRGADFGAPNTYNTQVENGLSPTELAATLLASEEYYLKAIDVLGPGTG